MTDTVLPEPIFEGSEKRLELHFQPCRSECTTGLRDVPRASLDHLMSLAACEIVSKTSNDTFDSYVLSESSLFVYPACWVLKTCGNTKLLDCLAELLSVAAECSLVPAYAKYSRASFLFPDRQPSTYTSFDSELVLLRRHLGHLGNGGSAFVLGDGLHGLQWHVFVACVSTGGPGSGSPVAASLRYRVELPTSASSASLMLEDGESTGAEEGPAFAPHFTLEVCMTDLDEDCAAQFVRGKEFVSAAHTTTASGIRNLLPNGLVDDYVFEPCGYSMNGIHESTLLTVHVTPEAGFSYASCELHGTAVGAMHPGTSAADIAAIFRPARLVIAATTRRPSSQSHYAWADSVSIPGYGCAGATCQELPTGGRIWFYSLVKHGFTTCPRTGSTPCIAHAWPTFSSAAAEAPPVATSEEQMEEDSVAHKDSVLHSDSASSRLHVELEEASSGLDEQPMSLDSACDVLARFSTVSIPSSKQASVQAILEALMQQSAHSDTIALFDLSAVSAAHARFRATLPTAMPCHSLSRCADAAALTLLACLRTAFTVNSAAEARALAAAPVRPSQAVDVLNTRLSPRDIRAVAKALPSARFAFANCAQLAALRRYAPGAPLALTVRAVAPPGGVAAAVALVEAATAAGCRVTGLHSVAEGIDSVAHGKALLRLVQQLAEAVAPAARCLECVHLSWTDCSASAVESAVLASILSGEEMCDMRSRLSVSMSGLAANAVTYAAFVHTVDDDGDLVHVTDLPQDAGVELTAVRQGEECAFQGAALEVRKVTDGVRQRMSLLPRLCVGDRLVFGHAGLAAEVHELPQGHTLYGTPPEGLGAPH